MQQPIRRPAWLEFAVLLIISAMAAWLVNVGRPEPLPWWADYTVKKVEETVSQGLLVLSPAEAMAVWKSGERPFVDARDPDEFAMGHIQGAKNIPAEALLTGLESAVSGLAKDKPLLLYCADVACPKSRDLAQGMKEMGFTALAVMPEGLDGWKAAGGPVEGM